MITILIFQKNSVILLLYPFTIITFTFCIESEILFPCIFYNSIFKHLSIFKFCHFPHYESISSIFSIKLCLNFNIVLIPLYPFFVCSPSNANIGYLSNIIYLLSLNMLYNSSFRFNTQHIISFIIVNLELGSYNN